jgi:hypothetical protein
MADVPPFDVFISYHSGDSDRVAKLKSALESKGLNVWIDSDQIKPGDLFAEAIERGLEESKSVALIVSAGSMRSGWVKEEYYRALGLANASGHNLRLIPVLIDSTPLPGFLASRSWADFRDPGRFTQSVDQLYRGITASREAAGDPEPHEGAHSESQAKPAIDELTYLERALNRESQSIRRLQIVRIAAPIAGLVVDGIFAVSASGLQSVNLLFIGVGTPIITFLIGWAATARQLASSKPNVARLTCLKDGLELCRSKNESGCSRLWTEFWRIVHRSAGLDPA